MADLEYDVVKKQELNQAQILAGDIQNGQSWQAFDSGRRFMKPVAGGTPRPDTPLASDVVNDSAVTGATASDALNSIALDIDALKETTKYLVSTYEELKNACAVTSADEKGIFVTETITIPSGDPLITKNNNTVYGVGVIWATGATIDGSQGAISFKSDVILIGNTAVDLLQRDVNTRIVRSSAGSVTLGISGGALIYESIQASITVSSGVATKTFWDNTAKPLLGQTEVTETGDDEGVMFKNQVSVHGELIAGVDSYPVPIAFHCKDVNTTGRVVTGATDITDILQSDSGSTTGLFGGTATGDYVLVGSPSTYEGVKIKYNTLATVEPENMQTQPYFSNVIGFVNAPIMATNADYPHEAHGWNIATDGHLSEQLFFGFDPLNRFGVALWEETTWNINGVDYTGYFGRFVLTAPITGDPVIEQIKLHTNRQEFEDTGTFRYGRARQPLQLINGLNDAAPNGLYDPANETVSYTPEISVKYTDNEFTSTADDGFAVVISNRIELDTSVPLTLSISYYVKGTSTGDIEFTLSGTQVNDGYVYNGANVGVTETFLETISAPSNLIRRTIKKTVLIDQLQGEAAVVLSLSRLAGSSAADTLNSNVIITNVIATGYSWRG